MFFAERTQQHMTALDDREQFLALAVIGEQLVGSGLGDVLVAVLHRPDVELHTIVPVELTGSLHRLLGERRSAGPGDLLQQGGSRLAVLLGESLLVGLRLHHLLARGGGGVSGRLPFGDDLFVGCFGGTGCDLGVPLRAQTTSQHRHSSEHVGFHESSVFVG